jgi:DNA-binding GntR family transcriptional regulator
MELDRPKTLTNAVVDYIREAVLRNEFPPGHQLRELPLSQSLATSRGTVREALRVLHEDGLVKIVPHHGAVVAELSPKRVSEIFDLRALLEGHAVELAVAGDLVDDRAVEDMRTAFDELAAIAGEGDHFATVEADMAFHRRMAGYSGHELLLEQLDTLRLQARQAILYTKLWNTDLVGEAELHEPILEAFIAGDAAKAGDAVRAHISEAGERLLARMREGGPDQ